MLYTLRVRKPVLGMSEVLIEAEDQPEADWREGATVRAPPVW